MFIVADTLNGLRKRRNYSAFIDLTFSWIAENLLMVHVFLFITGFFYRFTIPMVPRYLFVYYCMNICNMSNVCKIFAIKRFS